MDLDAIFKDFTADDLQYNGLKLLLAKTNAQKKPVVQQTQRKPKNAPLDLKRRHRNTKCHFITKLYPNPTEVPKSISKDVLTWSVPRPDGAIAFDLCFYVKEVQDFIVANAANVGNTPQEKVKAQPTCPMFEHDQINKMFVREGLQEFHVGEWMLPEFHAAFLEYNLLQVSEKHAADDRVRAIVVEYLQKYLTEKANEVTTVGVLRELDQKENDAEKDAEKEKPHDEKDEKTLETKKNEKKTWYRIPGLFWYATKKSVAFLFQQVKSNAVRLAKLTVWFLSNPTYLYMATVVMRTIRIILCVYMSYSDMTEDVIDGLFNRLLESVVGYGRIPLYFARATLKCIFASFNLVTLDLKSMGGCGSAIMDTITEVIYQFTPNFVANSGAVAAHWIGNTLGETGGFFVRTVGSMLGAVGLDFLSGYGKVMNGNEQALLGVLGYNKEVTAIQNIRVAFQTWKAADMDFAAICLLLDIIILCADIVLMPEDAVRNFAIMVAKMIPVIGPTLVAKIEEFFPATTKKETTEGLGLVEVGKLAFKVPQVIAAATSIRYIFGILRRGFGLLKFQAIISDAIEEIREWFMDLFPCLFRKIGDMLMYLFSFGSIEKYFSAAHAKNTVGADTLPGTCCMTAIIREINKQVYVGEVGRKLAIDIQNNEQAQSQVGWMDYLGDEGEQLAINERTQDLANRQAAYDKLVKATGFTSSYSTGSFGKSMRYGWGANQQLDQQVLATENPLLSLQNQSLQGNANTMRIDKAIVDGIPCADKDFIDTHHLPTCIVNLQVGREILPFYLCLYGKNVQWVPCKDDVLARMPHLVKRNRDNNMIIPVNIFTQHQQLFLSELETPIIRFVV